MKGIELLRQKTSHPVTPEMDQRFWDKLQRRNSPARYWARALQGALQVRWVGAIIVLTLAIGLSRYYKPDHRLSKEDGLVEMVGNPGVISALDDELIDISLLNEFHEQDFNEEEINAMLSI